MNLQIFGKEPVRSTHHLPGNLVYSGSPEDWHRTQMPSLRSGPRFFVRYDNECGWVVFSCVKDPHLLFDWIWLNVTSYTRNPSSYGLTRAGLLSSHLVVYHNCIRPNP